jgi:hypothetical protein
MARNEIYAGYFKIEPLMEGDKETALQMYAIKPRFSPFGGLTVKWDLYESLIEEVRKILELMPIRVNGYDWDLDVNPETTYCFFRKVTSIEKNKKLENKDDHSIEFIHHVNELRDLPKKYGVAVIKGEDAKKTLLELSQLVDMAK